MGVRCSTQHSFANRRTDVLFALASRVQLQEPARASERENTKCAQAKIAVLCKASRLSGANGLYTRYAIVSIYAYEKWKENTGSWDSLTLTSVGKPVMMGSYSEHVICHEPIMVVA
jgi:hypothetical protein